MIKREMYEVVDSLTGIVNACRTLPKDPGAPTIFQVTARMADTTPYLDLRGDPYNSGAGLTEQAAWDASLGEAIERYCVSVVQPERMFFGSWNELPKDWDPLHPSEVALFDGFPRDLSPREVFLEDTPLGWLPGESLIKRRSRLVPACLVHIPYGPNFPREVLIAPAISTGCACGPSLETAILSGLYESIERDAFSIVWLNRLPVSRLVLDEPWLQNLFVDRFARPNLEYHLFVLELDIAVPTVICLIRDTNFDPPVLCIGGASRIDIRDSALKALIEAVQGWSWSRYHRIKNRTMLVPGDFADIQSFEAHVKLYACADMSEAVAFLIRTESSVLLSDCPRNECLPTAIIKTLLEQIGATGTDVIALDLTTREIRSMGLYVVKTFCPQFQQIEGDHRFRLLGGKRWREVPVKLGFRTEPIDPVDVNPYPHPYA